MENGSLHRNHHRQARIPVEMRMKPERISDHDHDTESQFSYRSVSRTHYNNRNIDRMPEEERMSEPSDKAYYSSEKPPPASIGLMLKTAVFLAFVVAFAALIIGIVAFNATGVIPQIQESIETLESPSPLELNYPTSCSTLGQSLGSGLYLIRPNPSMLAFPVYCDMSTDNGGWTLVASVHENNIDGKCTRGDKWSSEDGEDAGNSRGSLNWENLLSFGRVEDVTYGDYKNPAYYAVEAKDVMIWHVPNGNAIRDISEQAFLKYYTASGFLEEKGGTLRDLFKEYVPIRSQEKTGLVPLLRQLNDTLRQVFSEVEGWHRYRYDGINEIRDGDLDLYDEGNRVFFRVNRQLDSDPFTRMVYNAPYLFYAEGVQIQTVTAYPFAALAWVGEGEFGMQLNTFEYRVDSNYGADGQDQTEVYDFQEVTFGQMKTTFTAFNVYGNSASSLCEVYFHMGSTQVWNSEFPANFQRVGWSSNSRNARNMVRFTGPMKNVLMGYALLASWIKFNASCHRTTFTLIRDVEMGLSNKRHSKRKGSEPVTRGQITNVLTRYMRLAENFRYSARVEAFAVPVSYETGSKVAIQERLPTSPSILADPGYIQFRAINDESVINSLCPGVRIRSGDADRVCIGGGNSAATDLDICGDYAGWAGRINDRGNVSTPSMTGKSLDDINSSILIFTR